MIRWFLGILGGVIIAMLGSIGTGVISSLALEARVTTLEHNSNIMDKDISNFKSLIKEDIGEIKGQNNVIIKLLKGEYRERTKDGH